MIYPCFWGFMIYPKVLLKGNNMVCTICQTENNQQVCDRCLSRFGFARCCVCKMVTLNEEKCDLCITNETTQETETYQEETYCNLLEPEESDDDNSDLEDDPDFDHEEPEFNDEDEDDEDEDDDEY